MVIENYLGDGKITEGPLDQTKIDIALNSLLYRPNNESRLGSLEGIFQDKAKTQKASAKALLDEIELRQKLNSRMVYDIDDEILKQNNLILEINNRKEGYFFDNFIDLRKISLKLEDRVLELESEKRKESLECWRDIMFMKKYLLSSLKDYWDLARKRDALSLDFISPNYDKIQTGYQRAL